MLNKAEAVNRSSAVLAKELEADLLVIASDADAVYLDWGTRITTEVTFH